MTPTEIEAEMWRLQGAWGEALSTTGDHGAAGMAIAEASLKAQVDARRDALTSMLDRLGGDGVVPSLNGDSPEQVADAIYDHVEWLERRARCEALQDVLRAVDPVALDFALKADEGDRDERLHETRLRNAIIAAARR